MSEIVVPILVAVISGPLLIVMNKVRKENSAQHGEVTNFDACSWS
jgi:hypothetical protein